VNLPGAVFLAGSECQYKTAAVSRPAVEAEPCSYPAGGIPDISQPYPVVVACRSGTEAGTENPAVQAAGWERQFPAQKRPRCPPPQSFLPVGGGPGGCAGCCHRPYGNGKFHQT